MKITLSIVLFCFVALSASDANSQIITTIADSGISGSIGDGGPATAAELNQPTKVTVDSLGRNMYISEPYNAWVRRVDSSGIISLFAGSGTVGFGGDGGPATSAMLNIPLGTAIDKAGNVYIADRYNNRIRKVTTAGIITTIAGSGPFGGSGTGSYGGDGGPASAAKLNNPFDIAIDDWGQIYIADALNNRIRKIDANGIITTIAGNNTGGFSGDGGPATSASLNGPTGIAINRSGNIYFVDQDNQRIRKINSLGVINTVAGDGTYGSIGDGGPATAAEFATPCSVALDRLGNIFIADQDNQRIRKIDVSGSISTIAGNGSQGFNGNGIPATAAKLSLPSGISIDEFNNVYIADGLNNRVRYIREDTCTIPPTPPSLISGIDSAYAGSTITLSDSISGGLWNSSNVNIATVTSSGIVFVVSAGVDTIEYSLINTCGISTVTKIIHVTPLGITQTTMTNNFMSIFPNPAHNELYVENAEGSEISVFDINGKQMYRALISGNKETICIESLPKGVYVINIHQFSAELSVTKKVLIE